MDKKWHLTYWKNSRGISPVFDFISQLSEKAVAKVYHALNFLEEFGPRVGLPHTKKIIGTKIWELRILGSDNIRVFYVLTKDNSVLVLHGFIKKRQKTDKKEIDIARTREEEWVG